MSINVASCSHIRSNLNPSSTYGLAYVKRTSADMPRSYFNVTLSKLKVLASLVKLNPVGTDSGWPKFGLAMC
jgi:hypothetical protein